MGHTIHNEKHKMEKNNLNDEEQNINHEGGKGECELGHIKKNTTKMTNISYCYSIFLCKMQQ